MISLVMKLCQFPRGRIHLKKKKKGLKSRVYMAINSTASH